MLQPESLSNRINTRTGDSVLAIELQYTVPGKGIALELGDVIKSPAQDTPLGSLVIIITADLYRIVIKQGGPRYPEKTVFHNGAIAVTRIKFKNFRIRANTSQHDQHCNRQS